MAKARLFVSVPMKDRTSADIRESIKRLQYYAETVWDREFEVVSAYSNSEVPTDDVSKYPVFHLGNAIKLMSTCDYFIGVEYDFLYSGCNVERTVACEYGYKMLTVPIQYIMRPVEWAKHEKLLNEELTRRAGC